MQSYYKDTILIWLSQKTPFENLCYIAIRLILISLFIIFLTTVNYKLIDTKKTNAQKIKTNSRGPLIIRAVACLYVLMGHYFLVTFNPSGGASNKMEYYIRALLSCSPWAGVWMFFTLSGYLIALGFYSGRHNISKEGIVKFYRSRSLRIMPLYYISILIVVLIIRPDFLTIQKIPKLFFTICFDQNGGDTPIGALWSVSTEFQFYLISPLIFLLFSAISKMRTLAICVSPILVIMSLYKFVIIKNYPELWHQRVYDPLVSNIDNFIVGFFIAFLVSKMKANGTCIKYGKYYGYFLLLLSWIFISLWSYPEMLCLPNLPGSANRIYFLSFAPIITSLITGIIIVCFELSKTISSSRFSGLVSFFGVTSYCIYVWQEPILLSMRRNYPLAISFNYSMMIYPLVFCSIVLLSYIFYITIEKPFYLRK